MIGVQQALAVTGLHVGAQTKTNLAAKLSGIVAAVGAGAVDIQKTAHDCCGLVLSDAAAGRIKWWAVAYGFLVVGWTSLNTNAGYDPQAAAPTQDTGKKG